MHTVKPGTEQQSSSTSGINDMNSLELLRLTIREVFVYALPALRSHEGYKAEDWNLEKPLITGILQIYQSQPYGGEEEEEDNEESIKNENDQSDIGMKQPIHKKSNEKITNNSHEKLCIRILEPTSNEVSYLSAINQENFRLFAECPINMDPRFVKDLKEEKRYKAPPLEAFVDTVTDSSRYFVIKCQDQHSKRSALLGIGFREREKALDFKATIQDYLQYMNRQLTTQKVPETRQNVVNSNSRKVLEKDASTESNDSICQSTNLDLSLKDGEKIKINLKGLKLKNSKDSAQTKSTSHISSGNTELNGKSIILPPPPMRQEKYTKIGDELFNHERKSITKSPHESKKDNETMKENVIHDTSIPTEEVDEEFGEFETAL